MAAWPKPGATNAWRRAAWVFSNKPTNRRKRRRCEWHFRPKEATEMSTGAKRAVRNQIDAASYLHTAGRNEEALDLLTTPEENLPDFYTLRGDIQFVLARFEEAAGSYFTSATLEPAPENVYAHYRLAICLHQLGRWVEA